MGRIKEIEEKVEWSRYHGDISPNEVQGDIEYLLSRLQIATQALDEIRCKENPYAMIAIAEEALEQIQKE